MQAVPIHIKEANAFIAKYHRHNLTTVGGKFAVGRVVRGKLVGVAVAGRPVARQLDDGKATEILRVYTDGKRHCCSFLYARVAKIGRMSGYTRVITYSLEEKSGASLRAVGGRVVGRVEARERSARSRPRKSQAVYRKKVRWLL
ncbi:MAG TPA: XF1762 family protein [Gemmataceae bacterium]|nr:XF1762 family protein [Gemmataceae bacterium]